MTALDIAAIDAKHKEFNGDSASAETLFEWANLCNEHWPAIKAELERGQATIELLHKMAFYIESYLSDSKPNYSPKDLMEAANALASQGGE